MRYLDDDCRTTPEWALQRLASLIGPMVEYRQLELICRIMNDDPVSGQEVRFLLWDKSGTVRVAIADE